jgi:hypothetical protein
MVNGTNPFEIFNRNGKSALNDISISKIKINSCLFASHSTLRFQIALIFHSASEFELSHTQIYVRGCVAMLNMSCSLFLEIVRKILFLLVWKYFRSASQSFVIKSNLLSLLTPISLWLTCYAKNKSFFNKINFQVWILVSIIPENSTIMYLSPL